MYDEEGDILDQQGPFYTYKRLHSAKELHELGSTDTLAQAQQCVRAVKLRLKKVGKRKLDKLKLKRPLHEYELNDEVEEKIGKKKKRATKKKTPKKAVKKTAKKTAKKARKQYGSSS
jgi:hypothetical protein